MNTVTGSLTSNALTTKTFPASDRTEYEDDDVVIPDFAFNGERVLFIGREDPREGGQHMNLENPLVSEKQAMIYKENGRFVVLDYELDFGTFVNTRLVADPLQLSHHDVLSIAFDDRRMLRYYGRDVAAQQLKERIFGSQRPVVYQFFVKISDEGLLLEQLPGRRFTPQDCIDVRATCGFCGRHG